MIKKLNAKFKGFYRELSRFIWHWRSCIASLFSSKSQRLAPKQESRRAHAGTVADLFATIFTHVSGETMNDMDSAMDILRHDFPNVEHMWLLERFQHAYNAKYPLEATLSLAAANRTEAERISLALEIYAILNRLGGVLSVPTLFDKIAIGLNLPGFANIIHQLATTPDMDAVHPIESLRFACPPARANVALSPQDQGIRFRVLRCVNILLLINDAEEPVSLGSNVLKKGDIQTITTGQGINLPSGFISYDSLRFLLQSRYAGLKLICYLHQDGDSISSTRQRSLASIARVRFGEKVEVELLRKDADFKIDNQPVSYGETVTTTYFTPFSVHGQGPYTFSELYEYGDASGHSFQLSPESRTILVTNLPYMNRPGALMLRPGLAPAVVFEVSYTRTSNTGMLRVLEGASHTLTVDGEAVKGDTPLRDGNLIGLSSVQYLRCRFSAGLLDEETSTINSLVVRGLTRDFVRAGRVVDNIDFALKRGEMACILGPSGSGKSTLLNILAGHLSASFGSVRYNDEELTPDSTDLRRHIAFIPREDILDESMTVGEHMYQASLARRPRLSHADRTRRVLAVLSFLGIGHLSSRQVGHAGERTISDGERTRLNLGLDLTGTAEVFLIDEPISGLSSSDAERVIQTLENMSAGRILLCTLHRPALSILFRFKKVMLLDRHGKMAFWGAPGEMMAYFQAAEKELGLHINSEAVAAGGADYVFEVLERPYRTVVGKNTRRPEADMWQKRYEIYADNIKKEHGGNQATLLSNAEQAPLSGEQKSIPPTARRSPIELWRLFRLWVSRTFLSRVRSRMGLYALLLEGPVLALLIAGTLRTATEIPYTFYKSLHISEYLFLSLVLAMFFGLTSSSCEILKDRPLIRRESNYKLFVTGYVLAKVLVLSFVAGVQCALYLLVGNWILGIHYMFWEHFSVMALTAFVGVSLSLMVSSLVRNDRTAMNIVPLLLVPQILLAGALVRFEEMNDYTPSIPDSLVPPFVGEHLSNLRHRVAYQDETTHNITSKPVPLIAEFCPLRYAFEMIFVVQTTHNLWEKENERINERREMLKEHGSEDELRFIQRAVMSLNTIATNADEARSILRRTRKAALLHDERLLEELTRNREALENNDHAQPLEFFFSNRKMTSLYEGVKTARKDARHNERRGFFLSPRQAVPFRAFDQGTDEGSVSTVSRNAIYLFLMGVMPAFVAARRLKAISRGK